jgi:hypothetical protein
MASTRKESEKLKAEIGRTQAKVKELGAEFARTGDKSLFGDLRSQRAFLSQLEKIRKELEQTAAVSAKIGGGRGAGLTNALEGLFPKGNLLMSLGPSLGAMLAPSIGAAINAAMLGGIGTVGLAGGIVLAARDPRIKSAFGQLGHEIMEDLDAAVAPLTHELLNVPDDLSAAWKRARPGIAGALDDLSGDVKPISDGLFGMVEHSLPGVERGIKASSGLAHQWAVDMPKVGDAVSGMFDSFARGAPGAQLFLHDLLTATSTSLRDLGLLSEGLSKLYSIPLVGRPPIFTAADTAETVGRLIDQMQGDTDIPWNLDVAVRELKKVRDEAKPTQEAVAELEREFREMWEAAAGRGRADISFKEAMVDLKHAIDDNGTSIDLNTERGRENARAFLAAAEAARRRRDAMIAEGVDTQTANMLMADAMKAVEKQAGKNKKAVHDFIAELEAVPPVTTAQLLLEFSRTGLPGEHSGQRVGDDRAPVSPPSNQLPQHGGQIPGLASGGSILSSGIVDIHRDERVYLPRGARVQRDSAGAGGVMWAAPVSVSGGGFAQQYFEWLRTEISARGGTLAVLGIRNP